MAEIKEQRSAFSAHEQGTVQEWLDHPCMKSFVEQLDNGIKEAKLAALELVTHYSTTTVSDAKLAGDARNAGTIIATLEQIRSVITEAGRYANAV
jgi:hypothetical protein